MDLEIATLCEAGTQENGKLYILGAFDNLKSADLSITMPHCAFVARIRFHKIEEGTHKLRVMFVDEDGNAVISPVDGEIAVGFGGINKRIAVNVVMGINSLRLPRHGEYAVDLAVDSKHLASLPLYFDKP